jgi:cytochrome c-type biogenesis protein CcsB
MKRILLALVLLAGTAPFVHASSALTPAARRNLEEVPILYGGRVRPFVSFAADAVQEVTGMRRWKGEDPTATMMRWIAFPESAYVEQMVPVAFDPLLRAASLDLERKRYSMQEILANAQLRDLVMDAANAQRQGLDLTVQQDKVIEVMNRLNLLQEILTHEGLKILPNPGTPEMGWLPPQALVSDSSENAYRVAIAYTGLIEAYRHGNREIVETAAKRLKLDLDDWHGNDFNRSRLQTETFYRRVNPWFWARLLYLITLLLMLLSVWVKPNALTTTARWTLLAGLAVHTAGLALRFYIGGRAPWSNMYESLITVTWGALLLSQIPIRGVSRRVVIPVAAVIGFANLTIAAHNSLSPAINPLVPALQSVWLNIHVIVILTGYASGALAMGAGHAYLFLDTFHPHNQRSLTEISQALYRFVQYAVLFLIVGILLGSIWAHSAWGRYWGWDPKETWALITWLFYLSLIHGHSQGWIRERGMAISSLFGFLLILVTYYGVNYYLAGLHSYAKGEAVGVPLPIILFVCMELTILGLYSWISHRRHPAAS